MRTSNEHQKDRADAGGPQPGDGEDRTAAAAVASRVVTREQTTDFPDTGEHVTTRPGLNGKAVLIQVPQSLREASPEAAHVDWLAFTLKLSDDYGLPHLYADLPRIFGVRVTADLEYGWNGYTRRGVMGEYGMVAWGGQAQKDTAYVSLNAHGCAMVPDWAAAAEWGQNRFASIRRVDLAHDDHTGEVWNLERLRAEYLGDGFTGRDGRKPRSMLIGDYDNLDKGRTYQIGSRAAGKLLRGYEKGRQLGDPDSPWFRLELELLAKNRIIPWDCLTIPGQYLAGAYPCLAGLAACPLKIRTMHKAAGIEYDAMLAHIRRQYGQAINLVMSVEGMDGNRAITKLARQGFPRRMVPYASLLIARGGGAHEDTDAN